MSTNYDKFMWWSISNHCNYKLVLEWYKTKRLPLSKCNKHNKRKRRFIDNRSYNKLIRHNENIARWLDCREMNFSNT